MKKGFALAVALCLSVVLFSEPGGAKEKLVMGVHPYKPAIELYKKFKPIAEYLEKELGVTVDLSIGLSYADTVSKIGKGDFHLAFLGPTLYVEAQDTYGVLPLAQVVNNGSPTFNGVIVVKKGSMITSLNQVKGKKFAFGSRDSTLNHVVPLWMLMDAGVKLSNLKEYMFLKTHDNVALSILRGTFDAAGLQPDVAEQYKSQGIEIIATSPPLPEHVFVATKTIDAATVQKLQKALLSPKAVPLYKEIKDTISGTVKFSDQDFNVLRKIMKEVNPYLNK